MSKYNKDVPSTSREATCALRDEGVKCGKPAHNVVVFVVDVMGKPINCKKMVCDEHLKEISPGLDVSLG